MKKNDAGTSIPEKTMAYIRLVAGRTAARFGFDEHEKEDFRQNLCLAVLRKIGKFDPKRGCALETYLHMCVDGYAKDYLSKLRRPQKVARVLVTLDAPLSCRGASGDDDGGDAPACLVDTVADATAGVDEALDVLLDVPGLLRWLDGVNLRIARLLMDGRLPKDIHVELGIPKTSFYKKVYPGFIRVCRRYLEG